MFNQNVLSLFADDQKSPLPVANIIQLYNVHERYLNDLLARVDEGLISDLYDFFRESWCMAVFHDRFRDLRQEVSVLIHYTDHLFHRKNIICKVRELLNINHGNVPSLEANVRQLVEEDQNLDKTQKAALREFYNMTGIKKSVEKRLLSYLGYNHYHLPMYAKPGMV